MVGTEICRWSNGHGGQSRVRWHWRKGVGGGYRIRCDVHWSGQGRTDHPQSLVSENPLSKQLTLSAIAAVATMTLFALTNGLPRGVAPDLPRIAAGDMIDAGSFIELSVRR